MGKSRLIFIILLTTIFFSFAIENQVYGLTKIEERIVRGSSLSPLISSGDTVKIFFGYYDDHKIKREDIIAYSYGGRKNPIIKIVKAIPRDKWTLKKNKDVYHIVVNGKPLKNSEGKFYQLSESGIKMLQLYQKSYSTLPKDVYMILGNRVSGTLDSTRFGLVHKRAILGKVEAP